LSDSKNALLIF